MGERGLPAPKPPIKQKPMKIKATEQAKARNPPQQNPQLEWEVVIVPIDHVPNPAFPNPQDHPAPDPTVHIPDPPPLPNLPVHIPNPPACIPNPVQPQNSPMHVPNPVYPQTPQHMYQFQCSCRFLQHMYLAQCYQKPFQFKCHN